MPRPYRPSHEIRRIELDSIPDAMADTITDAMTDAMADTWSGAENSPRQVRPRFPRGEFSDFPSLTPCRPGMAGG
ncbi:hypothetical protein EES40_36900 [Streptomyces sp. ADI93-02]|nr:hypothetical protein EES40_36900 [Streptomyces sp. ADI93-02]